MTTARSSPSTKPSRSNLDTPAQVATLATTRYAYRIAMAGHYVYLADQYEVLQIIDVADPVNPVLVGGVALQMDAIDLAVYGHYVLISGNGVEVVDVSNPAWPVRVGGCATLGPSCMMALAQGYTFIADGAWGLSAWRFSAPLEITLQPNPGRGGR